MNNNKGEVYLSVRRMLPPERSATAPPSPPAEFPPVITIWGVKFGLEFNVWDLVCRVKGIGFMIWELGIRD